MKTFKITTEPISVNRMYKGRRFLTNDGKAIKTAIAWEIRSQVNSEQTKGTVALTILFYFKNGRMDIDNALKALLDCMTGLVYEDDRQIAELHVFKMLDKQNPRIEVQVIELERLSTENS